ncbi:fimbrial protein [Serratia liquefaciens]|uniref:fimbrial protein n=1 Tax=Serratia liquefaciens TaxID=614 RepID=UPI0022DCEBC6|nr:fimbrial protein [Serratia liquefaciens]WBL72578.1 type 1 fimbrial protein [Serratia liquefaciens]
MSKIISNTLRTLVLTSLCLSPLAQSDSLTVNISGNIIAAPCTVKSSNPLNVVLPDIEATKLSTSGSSSPFVSFDLELEGCPASTTKVTATYGGTASSLSTNSFINTGTATQVVLYMQDGAGSEIAPNTTRQVAVDSVARTAKFSQKIQIYAKGASTPGTVSGNIVVSFTYQ